MAGLIGRHDADRHVLVIEPAQAAKAVIPADAKVGVAWYKGLTKPERALWRRIAELGDPGRCVGRIQLGRCRKAVQ